MFIMTQTHFALDISKQANCYDIGYDLLPARELVFTSGLPKLLKCLFCSQYPLLTSNFPIFHAYNAGHKTPQLSPGCRLASRSSGGKSECFAFADGDSNPRPQSSPVLSAHGLWRREVGPALLTRSAVSLLAPPPQTCVCFPSATSCA